jgi:V-type H+-transporting ATPase subunit D
MALDSSSAYFSLTQAEYAAGNFKQKVAEGSMSARIRIGSGVNNVAGVKLPVFSRYDTGAAADNQSLGLVGGGKKIVAVREKFTTLLEMLIKYVSGALSLVSLLWSSTHLSLCFFLDFVLKTRFSADKFCHPR